MNRDTINWIRIKRKQEVAIYSFRPSKLAVKSCLNVANSVTYLSQDFKLQGGKVGNGGSHFNGQRIVGRSVFVEGTGDLIKVAADFSVFGYQLSNSG